ncbi:MAG: ATP-binding protein [Pirellulales bacterium]|nr:ATP-binding protein [Pirellulales bacterium]
MSYQSFKRVLGESRLEIKCLLLFAGCLLVLILGSFWWYGNRTEELVYANTRNTGQALVDPVLVQVHWENDEKNIPSLQGYEEVVEELGKDWQSKKYKYQVFSLYNKDQKHHPATEEERQVYERFFKLQPYKKTAPVENQTGIAYAGNNDELFEEFRDNARGIYSYYQPVWASNSQCIICHDTMYKNYLTRQGIAFDPTKTELREGDLLGVVKIILPDSDTQKAINFNRAIFLGAAIITTFFAVVAVYVIVRYVIVKPLKHLRDVSDEVARGKLDARAEIQTADEFEDLANSFNKMVRHLVEAQEELTQGKTELDLKVDELAQLNMRLYEMNRLKSDFLATMSHELRTPLNSIIGFSDVLSSIKSLDDKQQRYVTNIQKSGRMLLDMINDILDLAKIESGKMELRLSEFRIDHAISAQCDMARPLAERKNIDLEAAIEPDLPPLFQDLGKLQQILNNLLSNAIKFTPEGGRITVSARMVPATLAGENHASENGQVVYGDLLLSVADTGVGISPEDQTAIFEKFRQGTQVLARGDAMTREYSGTGLGLSIVKELCKLLGGEINLHSELGKGSTFTVQLPWARREMPARQELAFPATASVKQVLKATA